VTPLAVYVHIPFCTVKCGYCDFNAYAGLDHLKPGYAGALRSELGAWGARLAGRPVTSIFFGGGTPGEVPASHIAAVLDAARAQFPIARDCEVSIEINPGSTGPIALQELRGAGVTRVSVGVQRLNAGGLRFLDRIHSPEAAVATVHNAMAAGFDDVSLDLMYGLPGETLADWQRTLNVALALAPQHLSAYALTIEEGTPLARRVARGEVTPADADLVADMYDHAREALREAGWEHYEISNFARPGHRSRHNQVYWRGGDYLGIGAGAHGYVDGVRYENIAHPAAYIERASAPDADGFALAGAYRPNRTMGMADWLEARLRLLEGFQLEEFEHRFGERLLEMTGPTVAELRDAGALELAGSCLRLGSRGLLLHSEVVVRLLIALEAISGPAAAEPLFW